METQEVTTIPESKVPEIDPKLQAEQTIKALRIQYKGLMGVARLELRQLLHALTGPNVDGNTRKQIKETIERAIIAGLDYGVDIEGEVAIRTHGKLGKVESNLAMCLAKIRETGMVLIGDKLNKLEEEAKTDGEKVNEEIDKTEEIN